VTLVLDIDDSAGPQGARPGPSPAPTGRGSAGAAAPATPPVEEIEYLDPSEMAEESSTTDQASAAEAIVLQAFPGASEVGE
jgi:hypothetical protein